MISTRCSALSWLLAPVFAVAPAFVVPAFAQQRPPAATSASKPTSAPATTPATVDAQPNAARLAIETPDGLPLEIELVSVHRGAAKVRSTASKKEYAMNLEIADKKTRATILQLVSIARRNTFALPQVSASVNVNSNTDGTDIVAKVPNPVSRYRQGANGSDVLPTNLTEGVLTIRKNAAYVRFRQMTTGEIGIVDLPVDIYIVWAKREGQGSTQFNSEKISVLLIDKPGDLLSRPYSFGKAELGCGIVIVNALSQKIIWQRSYNTHGSVALQQARRLALSGGFIRSIPAPTPAATPASKAATKQTSTKGSKPTPSTPTKRN
jgi:hypothetical protein